MSILKFLFKPKEKKKINKRSMRLDLIKHLIEECRNADVLKLLREYDTVIISYNNSFHDNSLQLLGFANIVSTPNSFLPKQLVEKDAGKLISPPKLFSHRGVILDPSGTFESFLDALSAFVKNYEIRTDKIADMHNNIIGLIIIEHYIEQLTKFNHILHR